MKKILIPSLISSILCILAKAQVGEKIADCEKTFGPPVKEFNSTEVTTKIFIKGELQAQLAYSNGLVTSGAYHVASLVNNKKQPITEAQLAIICQWNGITKEDLIPIDFPEMPELNGVYKKTPDSKLLVTHDKKKNVVAVSSAESFFKYLKTLKK